ncbi:DIS3-like uclease 1 [Phytophthora palmivora]|uniref:DIS3-like uclease 1 n=1 Tax=Phytophthora palmivora TaxID=4796 RepID=A0A2P4YKF4_9STRA|nr:DIS3-like uclease 1 [Phytophthora palmivora]
MKDLYERSGVRKIETGRKISTQRHSVLTVHVCTRDKQSGEICSKLHLIELAGCEYGSEVETGENNSRLFVLDNVISSLNTTNSSLHSRERTLAQLLQDSLSDNSRVVLICNASPSGNMRQETLKTLNYAQEVQRIFKKAVKDTSTPIKGTPVLYLGNLHQKSPITPASIDSKVSNTQLKKSTDTTLKAPKVAKSNKNPPAERVSLASGVAGNSSNVTLSMEEKLYRWKLAKQAKQKDVQNKRNSIRDTKGDLGENSLNSVGVKRKLGDAGCVGKTIANRTPAMLRTGSTAPKKSRSCHKVQEPPKFAASSLSMEARVKRVLTNCEDLPKSTQLSRISTGSSQNPIVIKDDRDTPNTTSTALVKMGSPAQKEYVRDTSSPSNRSFTIQKKVALMSKEHAQTTLGQGLPKQSPAVKKTTSALFQNDREMPISKSPELSTDATKNPVKPKVVWSGNPALDKENDTMISLLRSQKLMAPVMTEEYKPELLAKDLIRVAINFEKKRRVTTAFSIFKRAYHVLPKKSAKLVERLVRLECDHPGVANQVPSQEMPTSKFMVEVLDRDLMYVLNHGSTTELTELHAIGDKRAELIIAKRPFHQLQELQKVSGMSPNAIAKLYQHHTNWANHK